MSLPSSIWVKFTNEDVVLVTYNDPADDHFYITYSGTQYELVFGTHDGFDGFWVLISGDFADGLALKWDQSAADLSGSGVINVYEVSFTSGSSNIEANKGSVSFENWVVTSFTGTDISAASIVRNPVQYRLTADSWYTNNINNAYAALVSGTETDGVYIFWGTADDLDASGLATTNIQIDTVASGASTGASNVGSIAYDNWAVTSFTGSSISAASIVHRDSRLPLFVELPKLEGVDRWANAALESSPNGWAANAASDLEHFYVYFYDGDGELLSTATSSFSLDANNTGITDCPFVEWIGELPGRGVVSVSGSFVLPGNVDVAKPVIVEGWGAGGWASVDDVSGGGGGGFAGVVLVDPVGGLVLDVVVADGAVVVDDPFGNRSFTTVSVGGDVVLSASSGVVYAGFYCAKIHPAPPLIYKAWSDGVFWDFTPGELIEELVGVGMGCTAIRTSLFLRLSSTEETPWFKTHYVKASGENGGGRMTEDLWFCRRAVTEAEAKIVGIARRRFLCSRRSRRLRNPLSLFRRPQRRRKAPRRRRRPPRRRPSRRTRASL